MFDMQIILEQVKTILITHRLYATKILRMHNIAQDSYFRGIDILLQTVLTSGYTSGV